MDAQGEAPLRFFRAGWTFCFTRIFILPEILPPEASHA
jgi:hypothetical protein